ncbi:MAG TPA: efflux RND transporter periplasmic adaptor subunit [Gemmatimonadaceae bacterium]|nr:efflux RND transporter periplasmic adaptor subunit [Gemmatimonadaceae bacterium]
MRTKRRLITLGLVGVAGVAIATYAFRPRVVAVDTARVVRGPLRVTVDAEGKTRVRDRFIVAAPVTGRIRRIELDEGDSVRVRQVVAWIAPLPLDALTREQALARVQGAEALRREAATRVEQARIALSHAADVARRRKAVYAIGGISEEELDAANVAHRARGDELAAAQARARAAAADVDAARAALVALDGGTSGAIPVRAPCDGSVLRIPEKSERVIAAGTPILEIGDPDALEIVVDVLSTDAVRLRPGDAAEIVEWGGDKPLRATVTMIEPSAFTEVSALGVDEQRVNVRLTVNDPPATLGDGFRVEARMTVWEGSDVLAVPASALFQDEGVWSVFTLRDGRARRSPVEIGHRSSAMVEVLRGLAANDEVILFPSDEVATGVRVKPRATAKEAI